MIANVIRDAKDIESALPIKVYQLWNREFPIRENGMGMEVAEKNGRRFHRQIDAWP